MSITCLPTNKDLSFYTINTSVNFTNEKKCWLCIHAIPTKEVRLIGVQMDKTFHTTIFDDNKAFAVCDYCVENNFLPCGSHWHAWLPETS